MKNPFVNDPISRRSFIYDSTLKSIGLLGISLFTGGCEDIFKKIANRPIRRQIRDNPEALSMIDLYREAVRKMKDPAVIPVADNRSWNRQARIHDNHCPHQNWFFYSWHRAYLYSFENICRQLSGSDSFALPYWNWCVDKRIHSTFWGAGNPLFNATREVTATSETGSPTDLSRIDGFLNENDFTQFAGGETPILSERISYGDVESSAHNYIHGTFVRGDMRSFMSPLDPIFWAHHCMVDLCWNEWNITRNHANTSDTLWSDFNFAEMFFDKDGNPIEINTLSTVLMPLLSYRYETGINGVSLTDMISIRTKDKIAFENAQKIIKEGSNIKYDIKKRFVLNKKTDFNILKPGSGVFKTDANDFQRVFTNEKEERVLLSLNGINEPQSPDLFLRVFVNKPDANTKTPTEDPHFAGSFHFFTHGKQNISTVDKSSFRVDITDVLRKIQKNGELKNLSNLNVSVVAVPIDGKDASKINLSIDSMDIAISPIIINQMKMK